ncbi:DUF1543 domain-containing protein [Sphingomonas antarctica]|uniref:DUF1543 domain-containing protein n=1 Tax=Sphingomonas antarctica TaxID=2040274 RepID=UPI0039EB768A
MRLFAIYIGGEHSQANIEVHDLRFVVASRIADTYNQLRAEWWGKPGTLHIDCWAEIDHVDGYDVELRSVRSTAQERLYFVNLGGYDGRSFAEQHKNMFVVAASAAEAKASALTSTKGWKDVHRDDFYDAEMAFALDRVSDEPLYIHLERSDTVHPPKFQCRYTPLK